MGKRTLPFSQLWDPLASLADHAAVKGQERLLSRDWIASATADAATAASASCESVCRLRF